MKAESHARAERLIAQQRVEGIAAADQQWLTEHLRECAGCAQFARESDDVVRAVRGANFALPRGLAERTRFRVQLRAQELREREPKRGLLWLICGISWALGIATAPYVWHGMEWIGQKTDVPRLVLELGFGLWWAIPALFAAAIVIIENLRQANERDWHGR